MNADQLVDRYLRLSGELAAARLQQPVNEALVDRLAMDLENAALRIAIQDPARAGAPKPFLAA